MTLLFAHVTLRAWTSHSMHTAHPTKMNSKEWTLLGERHAATRVPFQERNVLSELVSAVPIPPPPTPETPNDHNNCFGRHYTRSRYEWLLSLLLRRSN